MKKSQITTIYLIGIIINILSCTKTSSYRMYDELKVPILQRTNQEEIKYYGSNNNVDKESDEIYKIETEKNKYPNFYLTTLTINPELDPFGKICPLDTISNERTYNLSIIHKLIKNNILEELGGNISLENSIVSLIMYHSGHLSYYDQVLVIGIKKEVENPLVQYEDYLGYIMFTDRSNKYTTPFDSLTKGTYSRLKGYKDKIFKNINKYREKECNSYKEREPKEQETKERDIFECLIIKAKQFQISDIPKISSLISEDMHFRSDIIYLMYYDDIDKFVFYIGFTENRIGSMFFQVDFDLKKGSKNIYPLFFLEKIIDDEKDLIAEKNYYSHNTTLNEPWPGKKYFINCHEYFSHEELKSIPLTILIKQTIDDKIEKGQIIPLINIDSENPRLMVQVNQNKYLILNHLKPLRDDQIDTTIDEEWAFEIEDDQAQNNHAIGIAPANRMIEINCWIRCCCCSLNFDTFSWICRLRCRRINQNWCNIL